MATTSRQTTKRFRVLWVDGAGEGRYTDIEAHSEGEAAWRVMCAHAETVTAGTINAEFTGTIPVPATEATR